LGLCIIVLHLEPLALYWDNMFSLSLCYVCRNAFFNQNIYIMHTRPYKYMHTPYCINTCRQILKWKKSPLTDASPSTNMLADTKRTKYEHLGQVEYLNQMDRFHHKNTNWTDLYFENDYSFLFQGYLCTQLSINFTHGICFRNLFR